MGYLFRLLLGICFNLQRHYPVLFGEASNTYFHSFAFLSVLPMSWSRDVTSYRFENCTLVSGCWLDSAIVFRVKEL